MKAGVDYIGVTCVFICHDGKGSILMHKRSSKCRDEQGMWDNGAGQLRLGETFEQGARREIMEEYGVEPEELKFVGVRNVLRKNGNENTHWVALIFVSKVDPVKVRIGDPEAMDDIGWFPMNKLPQPLHSMALIHLEVARPHI